MRAGSACGSVGKGAGRAEAGVVPLCPYLSTFCLQRKQQMLDRNKSEKRLPMTCVALGEFLLSLSVAVFPMSLTSGRESSLQFIEP